jgi:hypothetical protein
VGWCLIKNINLIGHGNTYFVICSSHSKYETSE